MFLEVLEVGEYSSTVLGERIHPCYNRSVFVFQIGASHGHRRGGGGVPNSPLSWVRECVEAFAPGGQGSELRAKTLIGLPFYGERHSFPVDVADVGNKPPARRETRACGHPFRVFPRSTTSEMEGVRSVGGRVIGCVKGRALIAAVMELFVLGMKDFSYFWFGLARDGKESLWVLC